LIDDNLIAKNQGR